MMERTVTVQPGDTLWSIAQRELGDGLRWKQLYRRNLKAIEREQRVPGRAHLSGPDWIFPGTVLAIPRMT